MKAPHTNYAFIMQLGLVVNIKIYLLFLFPISRWTYRLYRSFSFANIVSAIVTTIWRPNESRGRDIINIINQYYFCYQKSFFFLFFFVCSGLLFLNQSSATCKKKMPYPNSYRLSWLEEQWEVQKDSRFQIRARIRQKRSISKTVERCCWCRNSFGVPSAK